MKLLRPNFVSSTLAIITVAGTLAGCTVQQPVASNVDNHESKSTDAEDTMFSLASEQALYHVLRNVDRPFEKTFEKPVVYIPPDDNAIANIAVYGTSDENSSTAKQLFFVIFENLKTPSFAAKKEDLACLLVNVDGKVLYRDDDYWNGLPQDVQKESGAIDGDGPPLMATTIFRVNEL